MIYFDDDPDNRALSPERRIVRFTDLQKRLDRLKESNVGVYIVNVNAARANYPSKVLESYMARSDAGENQAAAGFRALFSEGIDHNEYLVSGARKYGISPWLGFRMNDIHHGHDPTAPCHSEFWRDHQELWCETLNFPCENTLDYSHEIVRRRMLDFIEEATCRYDVNGILLDWMRAPAFFPYGKGSERKNLLSTFMSDAKSRLLKAERNHGHQIKVAARVPLDIKNAQFLGLDAVTWVRNRSIDFLFIGNFFCGLETDAPVEKWHEAVGDSNFPVIVTINRTFAAEPPCGHISKITADELRGTAAEAYWRGASGVYPFNCMDCLSEDSISELGVAALVDVMSSETLRGKSRRHRISWHDSNIRLSELDRLAREPKFRSEWQEKMALGNVFPASLPAKLSPGSEKEYRICTARVPSSGFSCEVTVVAEYAGTDFLGLINETPLVFHRTEGRTFSALVARNTLKDGWTVLKIKATDIPLGLLEIYIDFRLSDPPLVHYCR